MPPLRHPVMNKARSWTPFGAQPTLWWQGVDAVIPRLPPGQSLSGVDGCDLFLHHGILPQVYQDRVWSLSFLAHQFNLEHSLTSGVPLTRQHAMEAECLDDL